ncbi:MAG: hypothetical protein ACQKBT_03315, partial [Puniceicoccales bacterium]
MSERRRGFALIISLSVMAFLLVLLLSLSAMMSVEMRTAERNVRLSIARENALSGMMEALGDLQRYAGPDQRVSATAEILDLDEATEAVDGVEETFRKWTGIWDASVYDLRDASGANDEKPDPHWLVSYDATGGASIDVSTKSATQEWVELVSEDKGIEVDAAYVVMGDGGGYAWWVGDEGVKGALYPEEDPSVYAALTNAGFLAPRASGYQVLQNGSGDALFDSALSTLDESQFSGRETLAFVESGTTTDAELQEYFHDVTPFSRGLLT